MSENERVESVIAEYRFKRDELRTLHQRTARISVTATAPRKVVSVTVGQQGEVTAVAFPSGAYKSMAPAELASAVLETARQAQADAREELAELLEPMMPPGLVIRDVLGGKADPDKIVPDVDVDSCFVRRDGAS